MSLEEDRDPVEFWLSQMGDLTAKNDGNQFKRWMRWIEQGGSKFSVFSPLDLIEYQKNADNGTMYDIIDTLVKPYIGGMKLRFNSKYRIYVAIKSFFAYNRAELPRDKTFKIRGDKPKYVGELHPEEIRNIVLSCNPTFQAIFLSMLQGFLGQEEFIYWNLNGFSETKRQLDEGTNPLRIEIEQGRKGSEEPFYTYIGTDAIEALRRYLEQSRPKALKTLRKRMEKQNQPYLEPDAIFISMFGDPISKNGIYQYWLRHCRKLGIYPPVIKKEDDGLRHRTGKGPHEMRDTARSLWTKSGRSPICAEFFLGHQIDKNGYDKAYNDKDWSKREYNSAQKYLNIMSRDEPYGKISEDKLDEQEQEIERLKAALLKRDNALSELLTWKIGLDERLSKLEQNTDLS